MVKLIEPGIFKTMYGTLYTRVPFDVLLRMLPIISVGGFADEIYTQWNSLIWEAALWRGALWS